ncbi:type IV secretory system conjugative DNA transfer family protein [Roseibium sp. MB-4]
MAKNVKRILGCDDGKLIFAPKHSHALLLSASGEGKTICGAMPWLLSLIAEKKRAIIVTDSKEGEIAAQAASLCALHGRKVAVIDDFGIHRLEPNLACNLNPFGALVSAFESAPGELIFSIDTACQAAIPEPRDDAKNQYFRDEPRTLIEFAIAALLQRGYCTPGAVWSMLAHTEMLMQAASLHADEGDEYLGALAAHVLGMYEHEHFQMHRSAALKAMRIYSSSSHLHIAGVDADLTHEDLIRENYIVFLSGPVRHMERLGIHYALHLQSFMEVVLTGAHGPVTFILDEFTNAPLRALVSQLTTMRGYGANCLIIAQSYSEIERKYGKLEAQTILENCVIRQWFGFSSYDEAERVSKAIGETLSVTSSLGTASDKVEFSGNYAVQKERLWSPDMLMGLPPDEQIIWVKGVCFIHCQKVAQNQLAPFCHELAPNPLEGGTLAPDPRFKLPASGGVS